MPRALVLGVSIVTLVYVAVSVVFLYLVAPARIATDRGAFAALAGDALFGRRGEVIFSLVVIISVAGSLAAVLMAAATSSATWYSYRGQRPCAWCCSPTMMPAT